MSQSFVKQLKLSDVRSHDTGLFEFVPTVNAVVGPNGSGKTTILEAIYTLLRGSSFRGSLLEQMKWGSSQSILDGTIATSSGTETRRLVLEASKADGSSSRRWSIHEKKYARLPSSLGLPVVLFEPDIGRMITGSPVRRRDYIDNLTAQLSPDVARSQRGFERTLRQRNMLLKQLHTHQQTKHDLDQLFVWNTQLSRLGEEIVRARLSIIDQLTRQITEQYRRLGGTDDILLTYQSSVSDNHQGYATRLINFLESSLIRDIALGYTSYGPHRDDIEIRLADQPAKERASRGEIRTVVLALKLLEAELLKNEYTSRSVLPTLLFDDVLSELDLHHQEQILAGFKNYQVFITTTDAHTLTPGTHTIALD